jgi:hypothetical protein
MGRSLPVCQRTPEGSFSAQMRTIPLCFSTLHGALRKTLEEVQGTTVHMTALLESLLALARADANVGDDHAVACFARRGSSGGGGALESPGPAQGLTLRFANSHEPAWILGDITALRRRMAIEMDSGLRNKAAFLLIQSSHGTVTVSALCSRFWEGIGRLLTVDTIHRTRNWFG